MQLLVLGFTHPDLQARSDRSWTDALGVRKGVDGEVEVLHNSQLGANQQAGFGALVGGLIGLGAAGEEGLELGAERGRAAGSEFICPLDLVSIGLAEAEALAYVDGDAS
jgi:hypothetical protein